MKRLFILPLLGAALILGACGSDESREDANDIVNGNVNKSAPRAIAFNNKYPNVESKCDVDPHGTGSGHRIFVTTGGAILVLPDPTCPGYTAATAAGIATSTGN